MREEAADQWEAEVQQLQERSTASKDAKKKKKKRELKQTLKLIVYFVDAVEPTSRKILTTFSI